MKSGVETAREGVGMGSGVGKGNGEQDSGTSKKWLHPEAKEGTHRGTSSK